MITRYLLYISLCLIPYSAHAQIFSDLVMTVDFYAVTGNLGSGERLLGAGTDKQFYFQWTGDRFVSDNKVFTLPRRDRMWIGLTFSNRLQRQWLNVENVVISPTQNIQVYSDHMYLFTPINYGNWQEQLSISFNHNGYLYQAIILVNWYNTNTQPRGPTTPSSYYEPPVTTIPPASTGPVIEPGWSVQIAAWDVEKEGRPQADDYRDFLNYGYVYAVREGKYYKVRIGTFADKQLAEQILNDLKSRGHSAFIPPPHERSFNAEWINPAREYGPWVYGPSPASTLTQPGYPASAPIRTQANLPLTGYAVQIASLNRPPLPRDFEHLRQYRVYYRPEGSIYKVLVGPYPAIGTAVQVRNTLQQIYPQAFVNREEGRMEQIALQGTNMSNRAVPTPSSGAVDRVLQDYDNQLTARTPVSGRRTHTVQKGETIYRIAMQNGISVRRLLELNGLRQGAVIYPRQVLFVE